MESKTNEETNKENNKEVEELMRSIFENPDKRSKTMKANRPLFK